MVLPYRGGYGFGPPRRIGRSPIWQEAERLEPWNPYYRKDLTGGDDEISLEDALGEKPQKYVPAIDQQPLRPGELTPGDPHRQAPDPFGYQPSMQASWTDTAAVLPRDPPQQDTQSVADVFGSPQSGATSMAETPHQKAARIAREAFARDPSLIKEFMPRLQAVGVDPAMGAPKGWALPDTGSLTAEDMGLSTRRMSDDPLGGRETPPFNVPPTSEQRFGARRGPMPRFEPARRYDPLSGVRGQALGPPPPLGGTEPASPLYPGREARDVVNYQDALTRQAGGVPTSPFVSQSPSGEPPAPLIRPTPGAGVPGGIPPGGLGQSTQSLANIFGGGAGPPSPFAGAGRPPGPPAGLSQMTPNIPPARPEGGMPFEGNLPRPRPMDSLIAGRPEGAPIGGLPAGPMPAEFANLPNGPRDISRGLIAGGQEARLPRARDYATARLPRPSPSALGIPSPAEGMAALPNAPARSTAPFLTDLPSLGNINQARQLPPSYDPLSSMRSPPPQAIGERIGAIPPSADMPDLTAAAAQARGQPLPDLVAGPAAPVVRDARLPRPRPEDAGIGGPLSSLPSSVLENISRAGPSPADLASGGSVPPEIEESDLPPLPPTGVQPIEPVTLPNVPSAADMNSPAPLIAANSDYAGSTARSRRPGFAGLFDREHYVGGPGLTEAGLSGAGTNYTKGAKPERGKYKPAEHERLARNIGRAAVGLPLAAAGVPLTASVPFGGMVGAMTNRAFDPNRQVFERGPLGILGGIFGKGRRKKDKEERANGTPPSRESAGVRESSRSSGGLGSDRGNYGYSTGGRNIIEGVGGRYGLR